MSKNNEKAAPQGDVTQDQAEDAVRTLLRWAGEDPSREGLLDTPAVSPRPMATGSVVTAMTRAPTWSGPSRKWLAMTN